MTGLFDGLKILDLSTVLAGPSVATFFAELGADVVKIENPVMGGDVTRSWKLGVEDPTSTISSYFASVNYNKRYVQLDLLAERESVTPYLEWCDLLITNFKPADYRKFLLTPEDLLAVNAKIIHARITGFASQPERVAYDVVLQAETGFMSMNGTTASGPVKMPVAMIDVLAAHQLKEGILCALIQRAKTGKASYVECSLEKAGIASLINQASNYLMNGVVAKPLGTLHPNIAPYGEVFTCKDGRQIVIAAGSDRQFRDLCQVLDMLDIYSDPRFHDNQQRVKNRVLLFDMLQLKFSNAERSAWMELLIKNNVPAGAIRTVNEVAEGSEAREMLLQEEIDGVQTKRYSSVAFTISQLNRDHELTLKQRAPGGH